MIWLTQKAIAKLFGVKIAAISKYLKHSFTEGALDEKVDVFKMEITTPHGVILNKTKTNEAHFYNIEDLTERKNTFSMEKDVLEGKGNISKEQADQKAGRDHE